MNGSFATASPRLVPRSNTPLAVVKRAVTDGADTAAGRVRLQETHQVIAEPGAPAQDQGEDTSPDNEGSLPGCPWTFHRPPRSPGRLPRSLIVRMFLLHGPRNPLGGSLLLFLDHQLTGPGLGQMIP